MTPDPWSLVPLGVWQVLGQSTVCLALGLLVSRRLADRPAPDYAEALLALGVGPVRPVQPGLLGAGGFLKARLRRILKAPRAIRPRPGRSWVAAAAGLALLLATGLALAQDRPGRPDSFMTQPHPLTPRTPLP
jgi:hypothetical protein